MHPGALDREEYMELVTGLQAPARVDKVSSRKRSQGLAIFCDLKGGRPFFYSYSCNAMLECST